MNLVIDEFHSLVRQRSASSVGGGTGALLWLRESEAHDAVQSCVIFCAASRLGFLFYSSMMLALLRIKEEICEDY
jgi:hypothetical protein